MDVEVGMVARIACFVVVDLNMLRIREGNIVGRAHSRVDRD